MSEIIKLGEDSYVVWYDEGPGVWGTREQVTSQLLEWELENSRLRFERDIAQRFERTDTKGRSSMMERTSADKDTFRYWEPTSKQLGFVPGAKIKEFLDSWSAENGSFSMEHVLPVEDDEDE